MNQLLVNDEAEYGLNPNSEDLDAEEENENIVCSVRVLILSKIIIVHMKLFSHSLTVFYFNSSSLILPLKTQTEKKSW